MVILEALCGLENPAAKLSMAAGAGALGGTDASCVSTSQSQTLMTLGSDSAVGQTRKSCSSVKAVEYEGWRR